MLQRIKRLFVRRTKAEHIDQLLSKCRAQETTILDLLARQDRYVSAAVELCTDFAAVDELSESINSDQTFIDFANRRGDTLGLTAVKTGRLF